MQATAAVKGGRDEDSRFSRRRRQVHLAAKRFIGRTPLAWRGSPWCRSARPL